MRSRRTLFALIALPILWGCSQRSTQQPILIAGTSAAYPFSLLATERFARANPGLPKPIVELGGNADGYARFCGGNGAPFPDAVGVTRTMTGAERAACAKHGVHPLLVRYGIGALVLVIAKGQPAMALTTAAMTRALTTLARTWREVDSALPAVPIRIVGPAPGSVDILVPPHVVQPGYQARGLDGLGVASDVARHPGSIGILLMSEAIRHNDTLQGLTLDGVPPLGPLIKAGRYPATLTLWLAVKPSEAARRPSLASFLSTYADLAGPGGVFADHGLIPLSDEERAEETSALATAAHLAR